MKHIKSALVGLARVGLTLVGFASGLSAAGPLSAADPGGAVGIIIEGIDTNRAITGQVTGLPADEAKNYKVVVYTHTDQWYLHPYGGQGEGKSWVSIGPQGNWEIATVKRPFSSDGIAALVIERDYRPPNAVDQLADIPSIGRTERTLEGTPDYGKL